MIKEEVRVLDSQIFSMFNIQVDQGEQLEVLLSEERITHLDKQLEDPNTTLVGLNLTILKPSLVETEDMPLDQVTKCMGHHQEE